MSSNQYLVSTNDLQKFVRNYMSKDWIEKFSLTKMFENRFRVAPPPLQMLTPLSN